MHHSVHIIALVFYFVSGPVHAELSSLQVPLDESKSSPASDLLPFSQNPKLSDLYLDQAQAITPPSCVLQGPAEIIQFEGEMPFTHGLMQARIISKANPDLTFKMSLSLDAHAALARLTDLEKRVCALDLQLRVSHWQCLGKGGRRTTARGRSPPRIGAGHYASGQQVSPAISSRKRSK